MQNNFVDIKTINDLHDLYKCGKPRHSLVTCINLSEVNTNNLNKESLYKLGFYAICFRLLKDALRKGRSQYVITKGTLMFMAPNQIIPGISNLSIEEGWLLCFHPDLFNRTEFGKKIEHYLFFQYNANNTLQVSENEKQIIEDCIENIIKEYSQSRDKHTEGLIQNNIELLINHCNRFYDRLFFVRSKATNDLVQRFEKILKDYFDQETLIDVGLPDVKYFATKLNISPNYLSDLLNKYTGKTTQEYIHLQLIDKAKSLLLSSEKSISEIAYTLGFQHHSHFTKIFKAKTGMTPIEYRNLY